MYIVEAFDWSFHVYPVKLGLLTIENFQEHSTMLHLVFPGKEYLEEVFLLKVALWEFWLSYGNSRMVH